jgi:perosamine synthetase
LPLRIDEIVAICKEYCIPVVEDAAESLGSYYEGKHTGTYGVIGTFSFNGNKTVTCGGGGAIVTNDETLAKLAKHITTTAKVPHRWEYAHDQIGYNYRMPNLNAALACAQLEQLEVYLENKRTTAKVYKSFFEKIDNVKYIEEIDGGVANYWLNAIRFENEDDKLAFLNYSNDSGVMTRPIWKLMNKLDMFKDCPKGDLTISEMLENTIVNIPSSVRL